MKLFKKKKKIHYFVSYHLSTSNGFTFGNGIYRFEKIENHISINDLQNMILEKVNTEQLIKFTTCIILNYKKI
jgi:hypothetical protein